VAAGVDGGVRGGAGPVDGGGGCDRQSLTAARASATHMCGAHKGSRGNQINQGKDVERDEAVQNPTSPASRKAGGGQGKRRRRRHSRGRGERVGTRGSNRAKGGCRSTRGGPKPYHTGARVGRERPGGDGRVAEPWLLVSVRVRKKKRDGDGDKRHEARLCTCVGLVSVRV
jgi:hypothetical protein